MEIPLTVFPIFSGLGTNKSVARTLGKTRVFIVFLGRKALTNLGSILKSRDIILLTEVCIVKAIAFPGIMYSRENWTMKKAEC